MEVLMRSAKLVPESPHFLAAHGKQDRARAVLERIARMNRAELPEGEVIVEENVVMPVNTLKNFR